MVLIRPLVSTLAIILPAALCAAAGAQQTTPPPNRDIVVYGQRLEDSAKALQACLKRHCPPDQDISASLGKAEIEFIAGDYKDAHRTLLGAVHRDKRYARQYPVAVSDLLRANARIAAHLGLEDEYKIGMIDVEDALKAGFPDDSKRVLEARVEVGDTYVDLWCDGCADQAEVVYKGVAHAARKAGLTTVAALADLHLASLEASLARHDDGYRHDALDMLDKLIGSTDPRLAQFSFAARVLKARLLAHDGDQSAIDAIIAEYRARPTTNTPTLIAADPIDLEGPGDADDQWIDVGFWIAPRGTVADAAILRQSPDYQDWWGEKVLKMIKSEQYLPLKAAFDSPGLFRVERYTLTAPLVYDSASRLPVRSPHLKLEMLDLSGATTSVR